MPDPGHSADEEAKRATYAKFACHELHLFIWRRDKTFFDSFVAPHLEHKLQPVSLLAANAKLSLTVSLSRTLLVLNAVSLFLSLCLSLPFSVSLTLSLFHTLSQCVCVCVCLSILYSLSLALSHRLSASVCE